MPDYCVVYNVGPSLKMNGHLSAAGIQDTLVPTSIKGLHGRPIRSTIIPRGATNGGRKLTSRFGPRLIQVNALVHIVRSVGSDGAGFDPFGDMTEYLTRVNTLLAAWQSFLEGQLNSSFTFSFTPTGAGGATSHTVTYGYEGNEFEMTSEGEEAMLRPAVSFGLVAETG